MRPTGIIRDLSNSEFGREGGMMKRLFSISFLVLIAVGLHSGCTRSGQKTDSDNILIAKTWLDQLRNEKGDLSEVLAYMSSEFNFDGKEKVSGPVS